MTDGDKAVTRGLFRYVFATDTLLVHFVFRATKPRSRAEPDLTARHLPRPLASTGSALALIAFSLAACSGGGDKAQGKGKGGNDADKTGAGVHKAGSKTKGGLKVLG